MDITIEDVARCLRPLRRGGIVAVARELDISPGCLLKIAYGDTTAPRWDTMQKVLPWVRAQLDGAPRRRQRKAA